ncbi:MAG: PDZ domain-containing protein [Acidimicrobiales bacterium]|jgi:PDZ domain-containing protein|nr:PDZ domain-containing protein [Acidimicrobiales bacterium]
MNEESTPEPMLPPPPDSNARGLLAANPSRWWGRVGTLVVAVVALSLLSLVVPAQWVGRVLPGHLLIDQDTVAQKPGSARETADRVEIAIDGADQPDGSILFLTVALDSDISVFDWLRSEVDDDIDLRARVDVLGQRSDDEIRQRNLDLMQTSKDDAVIAAMVYLGLAEIQETGVVVADVTAEGPAVGLLQRGDVIVGIDGLPITSFESLRDALAERDPGDLGVIDVEDIDTLEARSVELVWGTHPDREGALIGIGVAGARPELQPLPFDVDIESGRIGGPSAGLAFALTIIDLLSAGELTGGNDVAVTGTIEPGGAVGNVGGVGQKAAAAREAGAIAFIVPIDSVEIAEDHAGSMPVHGVTTLQEALDVLAELGGDTTDLQPIPH